MLLKPGCTLNGLQIEMRPVLITAEKIFKSYGFINGVTITSATDGVHSAGSLHYYGYALDIRTRHLRDNQKMTLVTKLRERLGYPYDVVIHKTHLHVEYDIIKLRGN